MFLLNVYTYTSMIILPVLPHDKSDYLYESPDVIICVR
jgi:hypothetical protein